MTHTHVLENCKSQGSVEDRVMLSVHNSLQHSRPALLTINELLNKLLGVNTTRIIACKT